MNSSENSFTETELRAAESTPLHQPASDAAEEIGTRLDGRSTSGEPPVCSFLRGTRFRPFLASDERLWTVLEVKRDHANDGYLLFVSRGQQRYLNPIPAGWETLADRELEALLGRSRP